MASQRPLPEQIGPYKVLSLLGEGGMGAVYEAADQGPVRRRVAVKVIRSGLRSPEISARFEAERQALGLMDHPGIARVLGAGETDAGDPYFVMELVKGLPLVEYCDERRLSTHDRITLFIAICNAVQHAHQKGVLHRDLKPSNILITEVDGQPMPKIIDFGIAKALGRALTDDPLITSAGTAVGTLAYMSPEQAASSGYDVDTRADIYSLGVILYELMVGRLPIEPAGMGHHTFLVRLTSRDTIVPRPSDRVITLGNDREFIARSRRTEPQRLRQELRGDLDWVVLKALEPDRARRYPTANALALDLQRSLLNEPVSARPPSATYRIGKFVRRHRAGVFASTVGVLLLTATSVAATVGWLRASAAEVRASAEADAARDVTNFVVGLFRVFDPDEPRGGVPMRDVTARELLDRGANRAANELAAQPLQQGHILQAIGGAYQSLGFYDEATRQLERALAARERVVPANDLEISSLELALGQTARASGNYDEATRRLTRAVALREAVLGAAHPDVAQALGALSLLLWRQGRLVEAESLFLRVVRIDEASLPADDPRLARHLMGLGVVYWSQNRMADAEPMMRRSLAIRERRQGADHPDLAAVLNNLGAVYFQLHRYNDALTYYERTRSIYSRTLDSLHPNVASVLNNLGETHWKLGHLEVAEPLLRRALAIKEAKLAATNPTIAVTLNGLGGVLRDRGQTVEAERVYRRALTIRTRSYAAGDANIAETARDLAALLRTTGRAREAAMLTASSASRQ